MKSYVTPVIRFEDFDFFHIQSQTQSGLPQDPNCSATGECSGNGWACAPASTHFAITVEVENASCNTSFADLGCYVVETPIGYSPVTDRTCEVVDCNTCGTDAQYLLDCSALACNGFSGTVQVVCPDGTDECATN